MATRSGGSLALGKWTDLVLLVSWGSVHVTLWRREEGATAFAKEIDGAGGDRPDRARRNVQRGRARGIRNERGHPVSSTRTNLNDTRPVYPRPVGLQVHYEAVCDQCSARSCSYDGPRESAVVRMLRDGWIVRDDDVTRCPKCARAPSLEQASKS